MDSVVKNEKWYNKKSVWKRIAIVLIFPLYQFGFDMIIYKYNNSINIVDVVMLCVFIPILVLLLCGFVFGFVICAIVTVLGFIFYNDPDYYFDAVQKWLDKGKIKNIK